MHRHARPLAALALLVWGTAAQAVVNHLDNDYLAYYTPAGSPNQLEAWSDWEPVHGVDEAVSLKLSSADFKNEIQGGDLQANSNAGNGQVSSLTQASWQPISDPQLTLRIVMANARAASENDPHRSDSGRVRFWVDYEFYADGEGARAGADFLGEAFQLQNNPDIPLNYQRARFQKELLGSDDGPQTLKGSWSSDWFYFSKTSDVHAIDASADAFRFGAASGANLYQTSDTELVSGDLNSYATLDFRYEVAPIPEPESYLLMALGLGGVMMARRRTSA